MIFFFFIRLGWSCDHPGSNMEPLVNTLIKIVFCLTYSHFSHFVSIIFPPLSLMFLLWQCLKEQKKNLVSFVKIAQSHHSGKIHYVSGVYFLTLIASGSQQLWDPLNCE